MSSRYDFMKEGTVTDIDMETFPDPVSLRYNNLKLNHLPVEHTVSAGDITKFWYTMFKKYDRVDMDDILLSLNGIKYIGDLQPGDVIYMLDSADLTNFNDQTLEEN